MLIAMSNAGRIHKTERVAVYIWMVCVGDMGSLKTRRGDDVLAFALACQKRNKRKLSCVSRGV